MSKNKEELLNALIAKMVESTASVKEKEGLPPTTAKMAALVEMTKTAIEIYGAKSPEMDEMISKLEQVVLDQQLRERINNSQQD